MVNFGFLATLDTLSSLKKKVTSPKQFTIFLFLRANSLMTTSFSGLKQQQTLNELLAFYTDFIL